MKRLSYTQLTDFHCKNVYCLWNWTTSRAYERILHYTLEHDQCSVYCHSPFCDGQHQTKDALTIKVNDSRCNELHYSFLYWKIPVTNNIVMNTGMFGFLTPPRWAPWGLPIITNGDAKPSASLTILFSRAADSYNWVYTLNWWAELDLNQRCLSTGNLQSPGMNRSPIYPWNWSLLCVWIARPFHYKWDALSLC